MACNNHSNTSLCTLHSFTTLCIMHASTVDCIAHNSVVSCAAHNSGVPCNSHVIGTSCISHSITTLCPTHSTLGCPSHAGRINPVAPTVWTDSVLTMIKAIHINELRLAILNESGRRSAPGVPPPAVSAGGQVTNETIRELRDAIVVFGAWAYPISLSDANTENGDLIANEPVDDMRDRLNALESQCVCNCNYACTCQCNYSCTCLCNYACTCQCNYACTCYCNYACTCQCNYACTCQCNYACTCQCNYACTCNCNY